jgi:hypothetical protein
MLKKTSAVLEYFYVVILVASNTVAQDKLVACCRCGSVVCVC